MASSNPFKSLAKHSWFAVAPKQSSSTAPLTRPLSRRHVPIPYLHQCCHSFVDIAAISTVPRFKCNSIRKV